MANLTKRDLVVRISNETGMIQHDVLNVIQKTLDYVTESLAQGTADIQAGMVEGVGQEQRPQRSLEGLLPHRDGVLTFHDRRACR